MKKYGAVALNALVIVFGAMGLGFTLYGEGFMNTGTFMYYTVQSNILSMLTAAVVLVFELRRREGGELPKGVEFLRLFGTIAISLTFLVFSLMLTPRMIADGYAEYLTSPGNLCVHNLVPICAILDWCLFGSARRLPKLSAYCGIVPALAYICFVYICAALGVKFSGNTVPYFFLDYQAYGWFRIGNGGIGVAYWIIILAIVLIGLGYGFLAVSRLRERRSAEKQAAGRS